MKVRQQQQYTGNSNTFPQIAGGAITGCIEGAKEAGAKGAAKGAVKGVKKELKKPILQMRDTLDKEVMFAREENIKVQQLDLMKL